jgi:2-keto-4-pentenoate hydratase/2-oxohepta-3-ene-1,7-dioic acid hydratase in catechol pathway
MHGSERPGLIDGRGQLRDLREHIVDVARDALLPESIQKLGTIDPNTLPAVKADVRIGPCVGQVGKIVCVGLNYRDHAAESDMPLPIEPVLFLKPSSAITGPNDNIELPPSSAKTDWEVELGIVIGKPAKYVRAERAFEHIAGYCIVNDVSERSYQLERGGQWDKGKGCDTFAPLGPWLVTTDEVEDPQNLNLWLEVDGHRYQNANTAAMIFDVSFLIAYISQFMSLNTGDIISTGTPSGVGHGLRPPQYLREGQLMRLGIDGLGVQQQRTVAASVQST